MMGFKDYLEKNAWVLNSHSDTKVMAMDTLGKWFLKKSICLKKQIDGDEIDGIDLAYWEGNRQLLRELAVDCLGKEKVSLLEHSDNKVVK